MWTKMRNWLSFLLPVLIVIFGLCTIAQSREEEGWRHLQPGLWLQVFEPKVEVKTGKEQLYISVLKIDPAAYDFHLLIASERGEGNKTLPQWLRSHHLHAAINAGMFWKDQQTSTGFMKNYGHFNNRNLHPKYEGFLVFNPIHNSLPQIQIIDREHYPQWRETLDKYSTVLQSFRMISMKGENAWEQNSKKFSVASIGITNTGKVLFIFCQTPIGIHDLNRVLVRLPLDIKNLIFLEGGPTAGLVVETQDFTQGWKGSAESFLWSDAPSTFPRVPNVIGITPKHKDTICCDD
ncbi:MAG: phosphodiester glycosidase family protein [Desulfovermiculus sp.]